MEKEATAPLISVIIPTYNRGWILSEALDSVAAQTFKDFELIVVDDGSTDNTADIIKAYPGALCFISQNRQGVSAARNRGVAAAKGGLIAFLDSDDLWKPEKLAVQAEFFKSHPETLICQTEEIWIRNGVRVNPKQHHKKPSGMIFIPSLALCLVSPSAVMLKRSLFEAVGGFDEDLPACEDYDLWLRIGCRHPIHLIDAPLTVKRGGHPDQLSRMDSLDKYRIKSIEKIIQSGQLDATQRKAAIHTLKQKCTIYAAGCAKRGRNQEAARYRHLSVLRNP